MEKRQLRIDVLGASFTIQSDESAEHLERVSAYLREKVEEVKARYSFATPLTLALLAALNIADELVKERAGRPARAATPAVPRETSRRSPRASSSRSTARWLARARRRGRTRLKQPRREAAAASANEKGRPPRGALSRLHAAPVASAPRQQAVYRTSFSSTFLPSLISNR